MNDPNEELKKEIRKELSETLNDIADNFNSGFQEMRRAMMDLESLITEIEEEDNAG